MNDYKTIEKELWNGISMLTSGLLTSLIYGLLSKSSYRITIEGKQYEVISTGFNAWFALGIVLTTFIILWILIFALIPWILKIKQRFTYDRIKFITSKELLRTLDEARTSIDELYPIFFAGNTNLDLIQLYNRDLAKTILLVHRKFLPQNKKMRKTIEKYFRNHAHSSIITIEKSVSSYELSATVSLLKRMLEQTKKVTCGDDLIEKDCKEMEEAIYELEDLLKRVG